MTKEQSMQSVFSFSPVSSAPSAPQTKFKPAVRPAVSDQGSASGLLSSGNEATGEWPSGDVRSGFLASFLTVLTQVAEKENEENVDKNAAPFDPVDLTPFEKPEEKDSALSLENKAGKALFSKAILDLLASLKNGMEAGEDGVLAGQMDEVLDEALSGVDLKRLQVMLSDLRSRFPGQDNSNREEPGPL